MDQSESSLSNRGRPLPPVATRWKPGQSGNPKGRPRNDSMTDLLRNLTNAPCLTDAEMRSYAELLARTLVHQGLKGNLGAIKEIFNRLVGRVPFVVERINSAPPDPPNEKTSPNWTTLSPTRRRELTREMKDKMCEIFELEPFQESPPA
jgi:hypothetical protein